MTDMPTTNKNRPTIGVVGLGLIGGSYARACHAQGLLVLGADCCADTRRLAGESGVFDSVVEDVAALADADEILVAVPVGAMGEVFAALYDSLDAQTVVFDGGSCKRSPLLQAQEQLRDKARRYVPTHPVAGGEDSGFAASSAALFEGKKAVLCPHDADADAAEVARAAWQRVGAQVTEMTAAQHDAIFAAVSHLPHVLSFALVEAIRQQPQQSQMLEYAAGGFRDFTRIAGSHPQMWRDICLQNGDNILPILEQFRAQLDVLAAAIADGNGDALADIFMAARTLRRQWKDDLEK